MAESDPKLVMGPEEFERRMREIADSEDREGGHIDADRLMASVLRELGYGEGVRIFEEMSKWYA